MKKHLISILFGFLILFLSFSIIAENNKNKIFGIILFLIFSILTVLGKKINKKEVV